MVRTEQNQLSAVSHIKNTKISSNRGGLKMMIESLTSQLDESNDKLSHSSSLNQQLENQLQGTEANNTSLTSQLNEARNHLSEVEKNYQLLSGDHEALSNISLEQCDELIMKWNRSGEKLLQRRVSNETYL